MKTGGIETAVGHWAQLMEGLQESPLHFYEAVTAAIEKREIPDCHLRRVHWREGGVLSAKREYLRAERGGDLVDMCGAPFGNAFFASSWLCSPPPRIIMAVLLAIVGCFYGLTSAADLISLMQRNEIKYFWQSSMLQEKLVELSVRVGLAFLFVVIVSLFGIIRPLFFPPRPTYYRIDTAEMFYRAVHNAVVEVIQSLRAQQGLRLLTEDELKPIMRGFGR